MKRALYYLTLIFLVASSCGHNGRQVPDDVTLLWSDDKHGYCRNLSNPQEMKRSGGAGIYYHLSYHGDPASWIWLSPLSPAFLSAELTKAYTYGARKIWVFNAGDFTAEWRWNVLRGYASRTITIPPGSKENTKLRIYFLDPGITLQEILIH